MPDPAVPPTPPVLLTSLLAREDLSLRRIAGPVDADAVVHWVHTSEMADPYPYLLGGELLLTAGVHIPEAAGSGTYFDDYVSRIVAAGGAALGFGVAPVHDTVPRALVAACETHGLPLLEVPPQTTFSGVARAVWQLMAQARLAELRRVTEAQQSLASAASRPDPVPSVLRQLAQRLGGWAVLYGPEEAEIAGAGREPGDEVRAALTRLAEVVRPDGPTPPAGVASQTSSASRAHSTGPRSGEPAAAPAQSAHRPGPASPAGHQPSTDPSRPAPASATDTTAGLHLAVYALGAGHGFVLGVATPQRAPGDHTVVSVAAVLLSLLTGEQQSGTGAARSSALVRLLLGAPPEEVAPLLGGERWVVVQARPDGAGAPDAVAASALGAALGSALVDPAGDVVRVLVPGDRTPDPLPGWTLGVSAAVAPHDWPAADTQAARALARARATRTPLLRHGPRPALADLVPPDEAAAHARALLTPVAAHPALTETLRTWLSLHGSWDRTAVALSVHRNTVRQRITRCATLLETDLEDPDVRMELWFALRHI
ncbi:PucR family transcriptional regulator ligand-binding domain-containing protein [Streptomyces violaceus]|uniref:PucR family transcriptional regulator ligand-binding domain-containing protein n=1 Tax=Streptomyces violaceus TaxID=1936 RepID=A0ABY9UES0_STRVL|nr:PucR family transcriptional regulator ligand-binding domain-containing protein [Streptomyces janthinus]WND20757.1 PucR family transcriptional regulator ligand-binding domain-containing protein [Streptomyces janthinus]GGS50862.1 Fis family transcriptional regulator [Streptomyces janthinus]